MFGLVPLAHGLLRKVCSFCDPKRARAQRTQETEATVSSGRRTGPRYRCGTGDQGRERGPDRIYGASFHDTLQCMRQPRSRDLGGVFAARAPEFGGDSSGCNDV